MPPFSSCEKTLFALRVRKIAVAEGCSTCALFAGLRGPSRSRREPGWAPGSGSEVGCGLICIFS